jgi:hypothetical protein
MKELKTEKLFREELPERITAWRTYRYRRNEETYIEFRQIGARFTTDYVIRIRKLTNNAILHTEHQKNRVNLVKALIKHGAKINQ